MEPLLACFVTICSRTFYICGYMCLGTIYISTKFRPDPTSNMASRRPCWKTNKVLLLLNYWLDQLQLFITRCILIRIPDIIARFLMWPTRSHVAAGEHMVPGPFHGMLELFEDRFWQIFHRCFKDRGARQGKGSLVWWCGDLPSVCHYSSAFSVVFNVLEGDGGSVCYSKNAIVDSLNSEYPTFLTIQILFQVGFLAPA
jgi:hypothetical protein